MPCARCWISPPRLNREEGWSLRRDGLWRCHDGLATYLAHVGQLFRLRGAAAGAAIRERAHGRIHRRKMQRSRGPVKGVLRRVVGLGRLTGPRAVLIPRRAIRMKLSDATAVGICLSGLGRPEMIHELGINGVYPRTEVRFSASWHRGRRCLAFRTAPAGERDYDGVWIGWQSAALFVGPLTMTVKYAPCREGVR